MRIFRNSGQASIGKRIGWIDAARAMCMILVIIGHAISGFRDSGLIPESGSLSHVWYFIYTFHMAAFFVLSGLLAAGKAGNSKKFLKSAVTKIAWPFVLWSAVQIAVMSYFSGVVNHPGTPDDTRHFYEFLWNPVSPFWFLQSLFLMHVTYWLFSKYADAKWFLLFMIALRGCVALAPLPVALVYVADFGVFYALGALFASASNWPAKCKAPVIWAAVFGAVWFGLAWLCMQHNEPVLAGVAFHAGSLPAAIAGALFTFALAGIGFVSRSRILSYIGQRTMAIFVLHIFFVAGTRILFDHLVGIADPASALPAAILAGLFGPLIIYEIAGKLKLRPILGLG